MRKARVLFISSEIIPYLEPNEQSTIARYLPQGIQERGKEIRTFMPRFGCINERRHQLHEVIRLSGMNLIINDSDHPLIIKVASIQAARMQVYFIDNEEYFQRKNVYHDDEEKFHTDNDDRTIFFCRGVLETVKKLGWAPDIIHCHGWMTSLIPFFVKTSYKDDPMFHNSKVVYSVYNDDFKESFNADYWKKMMMDGLGKDETKDLKNPDHVGITTTAMRFADAVVVGTASLNPLINKELKKLNKPVLNYQSPEEYIDVYDNFYDEVLLEDAVLVD